MRIRQAELEYALGREELQLLSLVEEAQALQARFDKSKADTGTIFSTLQSGTNLALVAVTSNVGRWSATTKADGNGLWIDWALEGEGLYRGDRLLEANGMLICAKSRDDLQRILGTSGKCQLVVLRRKMNAGQQQQLIQSQEDNMRLQHRISYLEEQVKELQESKENTTAVNPMTDLHKSPHVTSINITSPPVTPPDKPEVYQRGNFIMTIVGGKPVKKATPIPISSSSASSASSASSISSQRLTGGETNGTGNGPIETVNKSSTLTNGGDRQRSEQQQRQNHHHETPVSRGQHHSHRNLMVHPQKQLMGSHSNMMPPNGQMHNVSRSISASSISINSDVSQLQRRERERKERERELRREIRDRFIYKSRSGSRLDNNNGIPAGHNGLSYSKSGEQLHLTR